MIPLPQPVARHVGPEGANASTNRSLVFDKGPEPSGKGWKQAFYGQFSAAYRQHDREYDAFIARRKEVFDGAGVHTVEIVSSSRLIIGHGLPHSAGLGFHFDRLRGVPNLPGSTVKGLLRETLRVVDQIEDATDEARALATAGLRIFGDQTLGGELIVEDAYPARWPELEVDILTPHYDEYYEDGVIPGDWFEPTPVPFLTLKAGQPFLFWFSGCSASEIVTIEQLLRLGLDWLGIGGKKSSGYGRFLAQQAVPGRVEKARSVPAPVAEPVWPDARLTYTPNNGVVTASWKGKTASAKFGRDTLPEQFRRRREGTATVTVVPLGNTFKIVSIQWAE